MKKNLYIFVNIVEHLVRLVKIVSIQYRMYLTPLLFMGLIRRNCAGESLCVPRAAPPGPARLCHRAGLRSIRPRVAPPDPPFRLVSSSSWRNARIASHKSRFLARHHPHNRTNRTPHPFEISLRTPTSES